MQNMPLLMLHTRLSPTIAAFKIYKVGGCEKRGLYAVTEVIQNNAIAWA